MFERKTCTRCGGSGQYSYCQSHGSTCFGCGGTGKMLTTRGKAAANWYREQRKVLSGDVKLGDWLVMPGVPGFSKTAAFKVEGAYTQIASGKSLQPDGVTWKVFNHLFFEGVDAKGETFSLGTFPDATVERALTKAQKAELLARAYAYQDTLTKAGTPRKNPKLTITSAGVK